MSVTIHNCDAKLESPHECPNDWSCLMSTAENDARFCMLCRKDVFFCTTVDEASNHASAGHCFVLQIKEAEAEERRLPQDSMESQQERIQRFRKPRCVQYYPVEDGPPADKEVRASLKEIGRVIDEELKDVRNRNK